MLLTQADLSCCQDTPYFRSEKFSISVVRVTSTIGQKISMLSFSGSSVSCFLPLLRIPTGVLQAGVQYCLCCSTLHLLGFSEVKYMDEERKNRFCLLPVQSRSLTFPSFSCMVLGSYWFTGSCVPRFWVGATAQVRVLNQNCVKPADDT